MVTHGGGPGLRVPRKRVELVDVMRMHEDQSIVSRNNIKITESKDDQAIETEISAAAVDTFIPPLRSGDDLDCDSDEEIYDSPGEPPVDLSRETTSLFTLNFSREPNEQIITGVEEEVADSGPPEERTAGVADDVDMAFDEIFCLLDSPLPGVGPRMPQLGTDLELGSSSRLDPQVSESFFQASDGKDMAFLASPGDLGIGSIAQHMGDDERDLVFVDQSQESSHSQPLLTTHNFMLSPTTRRASEEGILSETWPAFDHQADILPFNLGPDDNSQHSAPASLHTGNEVLENPYGNSLSLSIFDDDMEEQSSVNMVFSDTSRTVDHTLSLEQSNLIDHDRPSQNSGSVLASDVKLSESIHTVDSAMMPRPPSAGIAVQKHVSSSKDPIALSSDSERDSGDDDDDDMTFFSNPGQLGGVMHSLAGYKRKRQHSQGGSSQHPEWTMYGHKASVSRFKTSTSNPGQFSLGDWRSQPSQVPHQFNVPGVLHMPSRDGPGLSDHAMRLGGGGSIQYVKNSVDTITNRGNAMQLSLQVQKNLQVARTVPAAAESIMKDTLVGNNNDEELPPEGHLCVPLLKHQRVALAWMKKRELGGGIGNDIILQGGILADDQGLGKTISTISLILKERAPIKKTLTETLCVDVLDADDDSHAAGKAITDLPSISEKHDNVVPLKLSDSGIPSIAQNSRPAIVAVSSKFRPAAGTLVVCPTSVLRQWSHEIKEKVSEKADLSVLIYHGSNRTRDPDELVKYDVVLTTYSIVSMEVPKQPLPEEKDGEKKTSFGADDGPPPFRAASKPKKPKPKKAVENGKKSRGNGKGRLVEGENGSVDSGPLARVTWFRVVLDEAQSIKNARTQGARAAWGLRSKRRWCLSGTPIQNAIDDLYSYFRFLRYYPFDSYKKFRELVKDPVTRTPAQGYANLLRLLTPIMLRRTKATKIDGQPIVKLPERIVNLRQAEFSDEERAFYNDLENESRKQFQDYAAAGTLQSNYVNILWMLLRLRQACDHPLLVKGHHYQSTQKVILDSAMKLPAEKRMFLLALLEGSRDICPICSDLPDEAVVCVCGHIFCRQCISEQLATGDDTCCPVPKCRKSLNTSLVFTLASLKNSDSGGEGSSSRESSSSVLEGMLQDGHTKTETVAWKSSSKIDAVIDTLNALPPVSEVDVEGDVVVQTSKHRIEASKPEDHPSNTRVLKQEPPTTANCVTDSLVKGELVLVANGDVAASAKSFEGIPNFKPCNESAVKLENSVSGQADMVGKIGTTGTRDESTAVDPTGQQQDITTKRNVLTEKAIVFSQWTSMLDLLEAKLKEAKFNYRRLDGTMSVLARDRAVSEFKTKPEVNVIIMSLKAASLGLNMVAACHVLLLDVWWNPTTEDQAIDRAHRIGQTRPVRVSRFTVKNTIEDRILALQEKKRHMVASAFGENGHGGGNGHLSTAELDYLFNGQDRAFNP